VELVKVRKEKAETHAKLEVCSLNLQSQLKTRESLEDQVEVFERDLKKLENVFIKISLI
jgi:hypothetical protein